MLKNDYNLKDFSFLETCGLGTFEDSQEEDLKFVFKKKLKDDVFKVITWEIRVNKG